MDQLIQSPTLGVVCTGSTGHAFNTSLFYNNVSDGLPQLIFTNGGDVMMADIHGRFARTLVPSQGRGYAVGVAYHWHSSTVFWSDTNTQKVSLCFSFLYAVFIAVFFCECKTLYLVFQQ